MSDEFTEHQVKEFNRLLQRGLDKVAAMHILQGKLKEDFEVDRMAIGKEAELWAKLPESREAQFAPRWDCDPEHFYLSMDSVLPGDFDPSAYSIIDADVNDVVSHLQFGSNREEGPWSPKYRGKSAEIAYRWAHDKAVTPPLVSFFHATVTIVGGMHRLHLAKHYGATRMPLLAMTSEVPTLQTILQTASKRNW